jgi:NADPH oxidase
MQKNNENLSTLNKLGWSVYTSRGAGLCLAFLPVFVVLPVCKHSITWLRNKAGIIPKNTFPENSFLVHKAASYTMLFFSLLHFTGHLFNFFGVENLLKLKPARELHFGMVGGVTGHIMFLSLLVIAFTSVGVIRSRKFNIFYVFHHLYIIFFLVYLFHGTGCFVKTNDGKCMPYYSNLVNVLPFLIYTIERIYQELFIKPVKILKTTFSDSVMTVYFDKNCIKGYTTGQHVYIKVPCVSSYEWHPFTLSSIPQEDLASISIRCLGDWTNNLRNKLLEEPTGTVDMLVNGPFASPADSYEDYDYLVLVASGIGVTPFIGILKDISLNYDRKKIKRVDLVWIVPESGALKWFDEEISEAWNNSTNDKIKFHLFITEKIGSLDRIKEITNHRVSSRILGTDIAYNYGRPDFKKFFKKYSSEGTNIKVACVVCGGDSLRKSVKEATAFHDNKDVSFLFISESFE